MTRKGGMRKSMPDSPADLFCGKYFNIMDNMDKRVGVLCSSFYYNLRAAVYDLKNVGTNLPASLAGNNCLKI